GRAGGVGADVVALNHIRRRATVQYDAIPAEPIDYEAEHRAIARSDEQPISAAGTAPIQLDDRRPRKSGLRRSVERHRIRDGWQRGGKANRLHAAADAELDGVRASHTVRIEYGLPERACARVIGIAYRKSCGQPARLQRLEIR